MKHRNLFLFLVFIALPACVPLSPSTTAPSGNSKVLKLEDAIYEKEIKTVRLFRRGIPLAPAVTQLGQWDLLLEFDDLAENRDTYNASVIHCNFDWSVSNLQELDYVRDFNEFPLNNAQLSADTHIPYVHYLFQLPAVKLPGNYVLIVYRGTDKEDLILSRRFMVFENQVSFVRDDNLVGSGRVADVNQQVNFTINHSDLTILNPMMDVHVNMRQNHRWDNFVTDLKPSFIREIEKELEYHYFDENQMFKGGNEFRFFDLRSLIAPGRNVNRVDRKSKPYEVYINRDKSRRGEVYAQYDEMNGNYLIENYDFRDPAYTNYAWVNFELSSRPVEGEVYVQGAFTNWHLNRENRMAYDTAAQSYKARILMKQGWYDYQYYVKSQKIPFYYFEGSYFQTENVYEIFVYYRPLKPRADLLIGYIKLGEDKR
jgi:hypothetical protein